MCFIIIIDLLFLLFSLDDDYIFSTRCYCWIQTHTHTHMSEHQRHIDSEIERRKSGVEVRDL